LTVGPDDLAGRALGREDVEGEPVLRALGREDVEGALALAPVVGPDLAVEPVDVDEELSLFNLVL